MTAGTIKVCTACLPDALSPISPFHCTRTKPPDADNFSQELVVGV